MLEMNVSRVTYKQMELPKKPQGYGFEQVLRKEQEKLGWSRTYHKEIRVFISWRFDAQIEEDEVEELVEEKWELISNLGNVEYLDYEWDGDDLTIRGYETTTAIETDFGRWEPPAFDYEVQCCEKVEGCKEVLETAWEYV